MTNLITITGYIKNITHSYNDNGFEEASFTIKNIFISDRKPISAYIKCIAYNTLATYINSELCEGEEVIVVGRLITKSFKINNNTITNTYINCNTVSILEQNKYK